MRFRDGAISCATAAALGGVLVTADGTVSSLGLDVTGAAMVGHSLDCAAITMPDDDGAVIVWRDQGWAGPAQSVTLIGARLRL